MKTAVHFLYEFVQLKLTNEQQSQFEGLFQQAKQMEKEQIMNAWYNGFEENRPYVDHSEDYYNDTYKQQDNEK